jgi:hypothetical protein
MTLSIIWRRNDPANTPGQPLCFCLRGGVTEEGNAFVQGLSRHFGLRQDRIEPSGLFQACMGFLELFREPMEQQCGSTGELQHQERAITTQLEERHQGQQQQRRQ